MQGRRTGSGLDVARIHSGDLSLYGAIAEQMRRLDQLGIPYDLTPGVPAFAAAAAALGLELTLPGVVQTVILTRTAVRASPMPASEELAQLAQSRATLAIHLSIANLAKVVRSAPSMARIVRPRWYIAQAGPTSAYSAARSAISARKPSKPA